MEKKASKAKTSGAKAPKKKAKKESAATHSLEARRESAQKPCSVGGCKREYRAKGYCGVHYRKWRRGAFGHKRYTACSDYGCTKPMAMNRHGFCEEHFQNYYVKGLAQAKAPAAEAVDAKPAAEEKVA